MSDAVPAPAPPADPTVDVGSGDDVGVSHGAANARVRTAVLGLAIGAAVLLVVLVVLLITGRGGGNEADQVRTVQARTGELLDAANQQAVNVTSLSAADVDQALQRVQAGGTGDFLKDYQAQAAGLKRTIVEQKITSTSQVVLSAVLSSDSATGTVLIVVDGTVSNASVTAPQPRRYRMQLQLDRVKGRWLTSQLILNPSTPSNGPVPGAGSAPGVTAPPGVGTRPGPASPPRTGPASPGSSRPPAATVTPSPRAS